ncbi:E3 ubiquitin-protein ligase rnf8-like [Montipora foliosa]|uniref:E3 ubiquitin-protein ligase rnf8-like n=1 Tax=Montipora foliosa TaxID=591990 RepID=UPI0035F1D421
MAYQACLRKTVPVCGRNDSVCPNSILLLPDKATTLGRVISAETDVRLLSKSTPLMISRRHATISVLAGKWTIVDHESLNGVFINGSRILPNVQHVIESGDKIAFGVGIDSNPPEFEYVFESAGRSRKRQAESISSTSKEGLVKCRRILAESGGFINVPTTADDSAIQAAFGVAEEKIKKLKTSLEEKEKCHADVIRQLEKTEKEMQAKLLDQKATLENEKQELESALKTLFTEKLTEKEQCLNEQLRIQKESLIAEKEQVEAQLQEELNRKLEEKDKELEDLLTQQKNTLEQVIAQKEEQQNKLHTELENYKASQARLLDLEANERRMESSLQELRQIVESKNEELLKQQEETKRVEEETRKTVIEQMEDEFTCIICQDLFIDSTTLSCAHSFCEHCLQTWRQKKNSCPICRQVITGKPVRSLVLDNAIAKMVESMDEETKTRRQMVSRERQELKRAASQCRAPPGSIQGLPVVANDPGVHLPAGHAHHAASRVVQNTARHPRPREQPYSHGVQVQGARPAAVANQRNYHDRYENRYYDGHSGYSGYRNGGTGGSLERGYLQNNYIHGMPGTYYPGYGQCHLCGMRGHWAQGCPFQH